MEAAEWRQKQNLTTSALIPVSNYREQCPRHGHGLTSLPWAGRQPSVWSSPTEDMAKSKELTVTGRSLQPDRHTAPARTLGPCSGKHSVSPGH